MEIWLNLNLIACEICKLGLQMVLFIIQHRFTSLTNFNKMVAIWNLWCKYYIVMSVKLIIALQCLLHPYELFVRKLLMRVISIWPSFRYLNVIVGLIYCWFLSLHILMNLLILKVFCEKVLYVVLYERDVVYILLKF